MCIWLKMSLFGTMQESQKYVNSLFLYTFAEYAVNVKPKRQKEVFLVCEMPDSNGYK